MSSRQGVPFGNEGAAVTEANLLRELHEQENKEERTGYTAAKKSMVRAITEGDRLFRKLIRSRPPNTHRLSDAAPAESNVFLFAGQQAEPARAPSSSRRPSRREKLWRNPFESLPAALFFSTLTTRG